MHGGTLKFVVILNGAHIKLRGSDLHPGRAVSITPGHLTVHGTDLNIAIRVATGHVTVYGGRLRVAMVAGSGGSGHLPIGRRNDTEPVVLIDEGGNFLVDEDGNVLVFD